MTLAEKITQAREDIDAAYAAGEAKGNEDGYKRGQLSTINMLLNDRKIAIPEGITALPIYCFLGYRKLEKVSLPSTLKKIEGAAFQECKALNNIEIPENVTSIGNFAFYQCFAFTEMVFPEKVTAIGAVVLAECTGLIRFVAKGKVESIAERAFDRCSNCISYDFSCCDSVPSLGINAFRDINAQAEIIVPDSLLSQWKTQWASLASHIRAKSE